MPNFFFMIGDGEYSSEQTMRRIAADALQIPEAKVTYDVSIPVRDEPDFPQHRFSSLEALDHADVLIVYLRWRKLPPEQMESLDRFLRKGGAVLGLRTSTVSFRYPEDSPWFGWNDGFGRDVLGSPWISHHGHASSTKVVRIPRVDHEVLNGIESDFVSRSWLYRVKLSPGCTVLLAGKPIDPETDATPGPVAWVRTRPGGGRVFYTSLGHPDDFQMPAFRALLLNALQWCAS